MEKGNKVKFMKLSDYELGETLGTGTVTITLTLKHMKQLCFD